MAKVKTKKSKHKSNAQKKMNSQSKMKAKTKLKLKSNTKSKSKAKLKSKLKSKSKLKGKLKSNLKIANESKADYHHHYLPATENELIGHLNEDLQEAWYKVRALAAEQGEQRIYTSAKAIMFAKTICYFFVRPKKKFLETVIFLTDDRKRLGFHSVVAVTKIKYSHTFRLVHADQVEGELAEAIKQSYKECR
jgi:hypothetical protein